VKNVLSKALKEKRVPTEVAKEMAIQKVKQAMKKRQQVQAQELEKIMREKFKA
jgi:hypothetical protein